VTSLSPSTRAVSEINAADAAPTAADEKRDMDSAAAAAGLLGLSCAISASGEVLPSTTTPCSEGTK
jgi:hypothetical protein